MFDDSVLVSARLGVWRKIAVADEWRAWPQAWLGMALLCCLGVGQKCPATCDKEGGVSLGPGTPAT